MPAETKIEIALSKAKLTKLLLFSVAFLAAGTWMIVSHAEIDNPVFNNIVIKSIAEYGGVLFGIWGIYFFTRKLLDKRPGLVIDSTGIVENTTAFQFGLIPWQDISYIAERSVQASLASKQRFVVIGLKNQDEYIARQTNAFKRKLLSANKTQYGSPVNISTNGLQIKHKELLAIMQQAFEQYGHTAVLQANAV